MRSIGFAHSILMISLCTWPGLVLAQGSPNAEAGQHFERALALAKQKAYPDAIAEFNRAYQISPHFSVMYNLGQAYIAIDQPVYAAEALRRYLAEGGAEVPPTRRPQVEDAILAQEARIASLTIRAEVAGAVVRIDGNEVGRTPLAGPIRMSTGQHVVDASGPGYKPWELRLALARQEQRTVEIRFEPAAAALPPAKPVAPPVMPQVAPMGGAPVVAASPTAAIAPATPPPSAAPPATPVTPQPTVTQVPASEAQAADSVQAGPSVATPADGSASASASPPRRGRGRTIAAILVGAVGVGAIATGSVFGLRAFSKKSDSDKQCPNERCTPEGVRLNDQARDAATLSTLGFGVGIVAVGIATYLLLKPGTTAASPPATSVSAIELGPVIGSGQAGLTLRGVW